MRTRREFLCLASLASACRRVVAAPPGFSLSGSTTQVILGLADNWDSSQVTLERFERTARGWQSVGSSCQGRLGADGLVWGRGQHPLPAGAVLKKEGDHRAPAGIFGIGGACGYAADVARQPALPYFQVTSNDLWIEDSSSPDYNKHVRLDHAAHTEWELKQQMKQHDPAHALKLFILHNSPPNAVPSGGSSIFFHIWRAGGTKATSGCTTMPEASLRELIRWVDPKQNPVYVLLPRTEYARVKSSWGLP